MKRSLSSDFTFNYNHGEQFTNDHATSKVKLISICFCFFCLKKESLIKTYWSEKDKDAEMVVSLECCVCGGVAHGYNFDQISCESCKAFFRRNALRDMVSCLSIDVDRLWLFFHCKFFSKKYFNRKKNEKVSLEKYSRPNFVWRNEEVCPR